MQRVARKLQLTAILLLLAIVVVDSLLIIADKRSIYRCKKYSVFVA